jgi:hypothetical protein
VTWRDAERDPLGEFGDGEAPGRLKLGKYLPVSRIHEQYYCSRLLYREHIQKKRWANLAYFC